MSNPSWFDRFLDALVDTLRSRATFTLVLGAVLGWFVFAESIPDNRVYLTLVNTDNIMIDSIRMEFGFDANQSNLLTVQLRPQEQRTLVLNHPPARGFNVEVHYQDGEVQAFCANRGMQGHRQTLHLTR